MITITPEAVAMVEEFTSGEKPMDWFLCISYKRGDGDVRRARDGAAVWDRWPDDGWIVDLGGWEPNKVPPDEGIPLFGKIRVLVQEFWAPGPFPGGEIYLDRGHLKVRVHAT